MKKLNFQKKLVQLNMKNNYDKNSFDDIFKYTQSVEVQILTYGHISQSKKNPFSELKNKCCFFKVTYNA